MVQHIRTRCDGEHSEALPTQIIFVPHKHFGTFSINSMIVIIASLNSILPLIVSISLGATLSASSQRHIDYILDLNRTAAFIHLASKPVARFYGLREKYTFERQDLCFHYMFLK